MKAIEKFFSYKENQILNSTFLTILLWALGGTYISYILKWTLTKEVWYWFFSSIAQTFAGLVAFIAVIYIFLFQANSQLILKSHWFGENQDEMNEEFESNIKDIKNKSWELSRITIPPIIISIILIPFGSLEIEDSCIMNIIYSYKLNWILIFSIMGLCFSSLYKIYISMRTLLK